MSKYTRGDKVQIYDVHKSVWVGAIYSGFKDQFDWVYLDSEPSGPANWTIQEHLRTPPVKEKRMMQAYITDNKAILVLPADDPMSPYAFNSAKPFGEAFEMEFEVPA